MIDVIKQNLDIINERVEKSCARAGRLRGDVEVIAVTKTRPPQEINYSAQFGIKTIGENRVQELLDKISSINSQFNVHFIGQLQSNKVKYIIEKVQLVHSLDRISLADRLNACAKECDSCIKALIEVNIGREPAKGGVLEENLDDLLEHITGLDFIKPVGLMTVIPADADEKRQHELFAKTRVLMEQKQRTMGKDFSTLSMGMSRDYCAAVEEGATLIRLGRALFGPRE